VQLVAIGSGTPLMARTFAGDFNFTADMYVDTKRQVYQTLECKRGIGRVLGVKALTEYKNALAAGYKQGGTQGDGMQLGGTFLINNRGEVLWSHMEQYAGDHAPLPEILEVCKRLNERPS